MGGTQSFEVREDSRTSEEPGLTSSDFGIWDTVAAVFSET